MWTLECDGDVLAKKRIWLRPGKTYLFGRTLEQRAKNASFQLKEEKSVSRKHITLSVSTVKPGDGSLVCNRSEISIKDEATKFGTEIDGVRFKDETRVLKNDEHTFKLGKAEATFRIRWQPVVFTFSLSSKEMKAGKDPLVNYRTRLEDLDVKVIIPYVIEATTHVVSSKRNTAKGLQALINAKHIVAETYIDALIYATTPENLDELESLSPLEEDYDANWPTALEHLPAKSKEPSERPAAEFAPKPERNNIFEGYSFVFCDNAQYESLQAPITNGCGKALEYAPSPGRTTTEEIVRYVKGVAGEKGLGEFEDGSEGKGVVVVRFRGKKDFAEWAANLDTQIALALGQRLIEQSEFMDAILANDASILRRPLLPEDDDYDSFNSAVVTTASNYAAAPSQETVETEKTAQPEISQPATRRARARSAVVSRFKGFDDSDDDDDDAAKLAPSRPAHNQSQTGSTPSAGRSHRYSNGTSRLDSAMDIDSEDHVNIESQGQNLRKRRAPTPDEEDNEEMVDKLLPAAAAMKRRRIEEERNGITSEPSFESSQTTKKPEKLRKPKKEINIKDVVRERREAEEEAARQKEEELRDTFDGMNVEEMRNIAVIEEMTIPDRAQRPQRREPNGQSSDRWDERWNGRRNFKKFRRHGEDVQVRRGQTVIVPLEEVKNKNYGIGDEYWLETEQTKKQRKENERTTHSQSQSQPFATARSQPRAAEVPSELAIDKDLPDSIDVDAPSITRGQERTQRTDESSYRSQVVSGKRPAASQARGAPAKKQKTFAVQDSDSDSEDELKFRVRKRGG